MVKLFFAGMVIFTLIVVGAVSAVFGPLLIGINSNLGQPRSPFTNPVPQPVMDWLTRTVGATNAEMVLWGVAGVTTLLVVYTLGTFGAQLVSRQRRRRAMLRDLKWRGRVSAARESASPTPRAKAEFESMWD